MNKEQVYKTKYVAQKPDSSLFFFFGSKGREPGSPWSLPSCWKSSGSLGNGEDNVGPVGGGILGQHTNREGFNKHLQSFHCGSSPVLVKGIQNVWRYSTCSHRVVMGITGHVSGEVIGRQYSARQHEVFWWWKAVLMEASGLRHL